MQNNEHPLKDLVGGTPPFEGLDDDLIEELVSNLSHQEYEKGELILRQGDPSDDLVILLEGEVEIRRRNRLQSMIEAPAVLGLLALLDDTARSADVSCWSGCKTCRLDSKVLNDLLQKSPVLSRNVMQYLAHALSEQYDTQFKIGLSFDDLFDSPNAQLVPGPYEFEPFPVLMFVVEQESKILTSLLPEGLNPIPGLGNRYLLLISTIENCYTENVKGDGRQFGYMETTPFIPCMSDYSRVGTFIPELYPDAYLPIILGREIYGFPKRYGRTFVKPGKADLIIGDRLLLRATWKARKSIQDEAFSSAFRAAFSDRPKLPDSLVKTLDRIFFAINRSEAIRQISMMHVYVRRQLVGEQSLRERRFRIDELVEIPFKTHRLTELAVLEDSEIEFFDRSHFLGGRCVAGFAARLGFSFGKGQVRRDYLAGKDNSLKSALRRFTGP